MRMVDIFKQILKGYRSFPERVEGNGSQETLNCEPMPCGRFDVAQRSERRDEVDLV
jgi:hypothetical protein